LSDLRADINKVSPWRNATVLARRAVLAAQPPTRLASGPPLAGSVTDDDRRQMPASKTILAH